MYNVEDTTMLIGGVHHVACCPHLGLVFVVCICFKIYPLWETMWEGPDSQDVGLEAAII